MKDHLHKHAAQRKSLFTVMVLSAMESKTDLLDIWFCRASANDTAVIPQIGG